MCNIAQEAKMQLQMRCLEYVVSLVALVNYLGYMILWSIPVLLNFGTSFAVKAYLFDGRGSTDMCAVHHVHRIKTAILSTAAK